MYIVLFLQAKNLFLGNYAAQREPALVTHSNARSQATANSFTYGLGILWVFMYTSTGSQAETGPDATVRVQMRCVRLNIAWKTMQLCLALVAKSALTHGKVLTAAWHRAGETFFGVSFPYLSSTKRESQRHMAMSAAFSQI